LFNYSGYILLKEPNKNNGIKGRKLTKLGFWALILGFFMAGMALGI
jgi:hypothetical protein